MPKRKTRTQYRDAGSGEFLKKEDAQRRPPDKVVKERVPNRGYGDTDRGKGKGKKGR